MPGLDDPGGLDPEIARIRRSYDGGRYADAAEICRAGLERRGPDAALYRWLGKSLAKLGRRGPAAAALMRAVALRPAKITYRTELYWYGLEPLDRFAEGAATLRAAARELAPTPAVLTALASALISLGRLDEGVGCCDAALAAEPGRLDARGIRSRGNFLRGRYRAAWPDYLHLQTRRRLRRPPELHGRLWKGEDLRGRSILLRGEQGLGDTIQFGRYAAVLAARGAEVVVHCQEPLAGLLGRLKGASRVVPLNEPQPSTDWVCPMLNVPGVLETGIDTIPDECPYLTPRPAARRILPPTGEFRIAVAWTGNPRHSKNRRRSCRLDDFGVLAEIPGTEFVSFQPGSGAEELRASEWRGLIRDASGQTPTMEAAADALMEVDLVITVDTMIAHLAGALGRPVWTLLASAPDWRWILDRRDTPWYPSMTLFRQRRPGDWAGVFRDVRKALQATMSGRSPSPASNVLQTARGGSPHAP